MEDQLGHDDEANSQIADGSDLGTCRPQVTSVGDLPTCSVSAVQLILQTLCSGRTPPLGRSLLPDEGLAVPYVAFFFSPLRGFSPLRLASTVKYLTSQLRISLRFNYKRETKV